MLWIASIRESHWHVIKHGAAGGLVHDAYGHRVYGPFHGRRGDTPPRDGVRHICRASRSAVELRKRGLLSGPRISQSAPPFGVRELRP
jgi:hypothetical protein